jgi:murein DD-endopeptidase MepM/ murein hydrolase activator NlpD
MKLSLIYPVNSVHITQGFGANPQMYSDPRYGGIKGHNGLDFLTTHGQPVYATHDGVAYYEYDGNQGEGVVLRTDKEYDSPDGPCYYKTIYWHLCDSILEPQFTSPIYKAVGYKPDQTGVSQLGVVVKCGDLLGYADNTGASTGDHLHFGLKPQLQNESNGAWYNTEQKNGYNGAIDPMPFFNKHTPLYIQTLYKLVDAYKALLELLTKKATP